MNLGHLRATFLLAALTLSIGCGGSAAPATGAGGSGGSAGSAGTAGTGGTTGGAGASGGAGMTGAAGAGTTGAAGADGGAGSTGAAGAGNPSTCPTNLTIVVPAPAHMQTSIAPIHLAVDDGFIYWTAPTGVSAGAVYRAAKDGSGAKVMNGKDGTDVVSAHASVAVDATTVYVQSGFNFLAIDKATGTAMSHGGGIKASGAFAVDDTSVFIGTPGVISILKTGNMPGQLLRDAFSITALLIRPEGASLFVADDRGQIDLLTKVGASQTATPIVATNTSITGFVVGPSALYWIDGTGALIRKSDKDGMNATTVYTDPQANATPQQLMLVGSTLYFGAGASNNTGSGIEQVNTDGSAHKTWPWMGSSAVDLVNDGTSLFFIDELGNIVRGCL